MTIPIQPGPFSFLASAGEALGAYGQAKEQRRQQTLTEAKDQARNYLALRAAGLMKPKEFDDPNIQAVFHAAGFGPVSAEELPHELARDQMTNFMQQIISGQTPTATPEARVAFGLPQQGVGEAAAAQNAAAVPVAQVQQRTAEAALPQAGLTGELTATGAQQQPIEQATDDFVYSMATQGGGIPKTGADAYQRALADPRMSTIAQRIGQAPFDAAVERLRQKWYGLTTQREGAAARMAGATGVGFDDIAKIVQAQQARITAEINSIPAPSQDDYTYSGMAADMRARGKTPLPIMSQAEARVNSYQTKVDSLHTEGQGYRDMLTNSARMQEYFGGQGRQIAPPQPAHPAGGPSGAVQRQAVKPQMQAAKEYEQRVKGVTDPAQRKRIAAEIANKYGLKAGGK